MITTALALGTLSVFRWIETRMPTLLYAHHQIRFRRDAILPEERLHELLASHGFSAANLSYRLNGDGQYFEYRMTIRTRSAENAKHLALTLNQLPEVVEYRISPTGD